MFTMEEEAEEQDDCFKVYRKSLLYLVSHACEGFQASADPWSSQVHEEGRSPARAFGVREDGAPTGTGAASCISRSRKASRRTR